MRLILAIMLLTFLVLTACNQEEDPKWTRYEYLGEARDYIHFKRGTWWVYMKTPGGQLDTIEVIQDWIDTIALSGDGNTLHYERLGWTAQSRLDNYKYRFDRGPSILPNPSWANEYQITKKQYFWSKSRPGNFGGEVRIFLYPFDTSWYAGGSVSDIVLKMEYDTIIVAGSVYSDVKQFELTNDGTFIWDSEGRRGGVVQYSWAPGVGIIKREHMTKHIVWEMVESHIVQ